MASLLLSAFSSELRFQLRDERRVVARGAVVRIGSPSSFFEVFTDDEPYSESLPCETSRDALRAVVDYLHRNSHIRAVLSVHTVVHRLPGLGEPGVGAALVDASTAGRLHATHRSAGAAPAFAVLDAALRVLPSAKHVVVFSDGPCRMLPPLSRIVGGALPEGTDALVHAVSLREARRAVPRAMRAVTVLLGHRSSVAAWNDRRMVALSDALPGSLPGLALLRERTGRSSYDEVLRGAKRQDRACVSALMLLASRVAFGVAGMTALLGAPQLLVFSGPGASAEMVEEVCRRLSSMGITLSPESRSGLCSARGSRVAVFRSSLDEDEALARAAKELFARRGSF